MNSPLLVISSPSTTRLATARMSAKVTSAVASVSTSGVLDTGRLRSVIAAEIGVSPGDVSACILGAHGDTMVVIPRLTKIGPVPLTNLLPQKRIDELIDRSVHSGAEIVGLLKTGSAFYAHLADGAGSHLLLSDLKSQLDLLAVKISEEQ